MLQNLPLQCKQTVCLCTWFRLLQTGGLVRSLSVVELSLCRSEEDGETIMKTAGDYWVVAKRSDQREFYIILHNKSANLIEVNGMSLCIRCMPQLSHFDIVCCVVVQCWCQLI